MSPNTALAHAGRRVRALGERLPEEHRPDIAEEWNDLLQRIEDCSDSQARRIIDGWTEEMERRLCSTLLNAPLGDAA